MHITPINFGRSIKVLTPKHITEKIVESANKDLSKVEEKTAFDVCIKTIFYDVARDGKKVFQYTTQDGDCFIFSGKEGQVMSVAMDDANTKLKSYNKYMERLEKRPNDYIRMKPQIDSICDDVVNETDAIAYTLSEDGYKNKANTTIEYMLQDDKERLLYTSEHGGKKDVIVLDYFNN